jgi:hypothetical protein
MKTTNLLSGLPILRKAFLIGGAITLLISTCVIYPMERSRANYLDEYRNTFLTLAIALLLLMPGLMGKQVFKGLLFLATSSLIAVAFFYVAYPLVPFTFFIAILLGIPSGIITGLIFMIINFCFFGKIETNKLPKQIVVYLIILLVVSVLFGYGGDWF